MRKTPLIALSAFTALGACAIGAADRPAQQLTASWRTVNRPDLAPRLDDASRTASSKHVPAGRDLRAAHDLSRQASQRIDPHTGLPVKSPPPTRPATGPSEEQTTAQGVWLQLRTCESDDEYGIDTGNGYYGAYQFLLSTWQDLGYSGLPNEASPSVQDQAAVRLEAMAGWNPWPQCATELGL